jgi:RHS repeat-associated protein
VRDDLGRPIQTIDRAGGIVDGVRDARGNLVEVTDQAGATTRTLFDSRSLMTQSISPEGAITRFETDAHGNVTARVNPDGSRWTWRWDYFGRPIERTDPRGGVTRTTYSDAGNVLSVEEPSGRRVDYTYDAMGSCTAIHVNGVTTRYEFGGLRWRLSETLPDGRTTRYRFNREGWCTRIVNAAGEEARFDYDARGLARVVTLFDGTVRRNRWDEMGRLVGYDDGAGWVTLVRDVVGRVVSAKYPDGSESSVEYDALGMPSRWCGPGGDVRVERDRKGRIVRESVKLGEVTTEVFTSYDRVGRPSVVTSSLGYGAAAKRDPMGRRTALDLAGREVSFEYDPLGFETARTLPEGGRIETTWDVAPRVRGRTLRRRAASRAGRADEPEWVGQRSDEGTIHAAFSYDDHDNVISVTEPEEGLAYRYDAAHHLVARDSTTRPREEFFTDAGGRTHQKGVPQAVDPGGRIVRRGETDYTWDAQGRLIRAKGPGEDRRFFWTARSELARVELGGGVEVAFTYDPLGRRTTRTLFRRVAGRLVRKEWSRFVWSGGSLLHEYRELAGKTRRCVRTTYVPDRSHRVLAEKVDTMEGDLVREGPWMFHVHDASGAPLRLASADGSSVARLERDTFGAMRSRGNATTRVRLLGQLADEETGLHYNRHRYYDPALGTFIHRDPIGPRGGLEMYAYAPNPIGFADPLGLQHECTCRLVTRGHPNGVGPTGSSVPRNGTSQPGFTSGFGSETDVNFIPGMAGSDARRRRTQNDSQANSHTEMHATEWAEHHLNDDELEGSQMFLGGQHPPCAMCNRRMREFAENHGATVEYNWPVNNRLRYDGRERSNGTVDARPEAIRHRGNAVGAEAAELAAANQTTAQSRRRARARGDDEGTEAHRAVYQRQMAERREAGHPANQPNSGGHVDDTWP